MNNTSSLVSRFSKIRKWSLLACGIVAILGLVGYVFHLTALGNIRKDYIPMAPSTSLLFLVSVYFFLRADTSKGANYFLTTIMLLFTITEIIDYVLEIDLNFESRLFATGEYIGDIPVGVMSVSTALLFLIVGIIILISLAKDPLLDSIQGICGLIVLTTSSLFFLAYLLGTPFLYNHGDTVPMALTTSLGFIFLSIGIIFSSDPDGIPLRLWTRNSTFSRLFVTFLPINIMTVVAVSFSIVILHTRLMVNHVILTAFIILLSSAITTTAVYWNSRDMARKIDRAERARLDAEITSRKNQEIMLQGQKMEALGRLAGGIAHDFNNLFTAIRGHISVLHFNYFGQIEEDYNVDPKLINDVKNAFDLLEQVLDDTTDLASYILHFSRQDYVKKEINLGEIVQNVVDILKHSMKPNIEVSVDMDKGNLTTYGSQTAFQQIFMNLLVNAADALPSGGTIRVLGRISSAEPISKGEGESNEETILFQVIDEGVGIDQELLERVFDPYFTSKPPGQGTGLGLNIVYNAVKDMNGKIRIDSEVGRGTTISLEFPRVIEDKGSPKLD